ncbi:hypothetical protein AAVH_22812 [Aphelenchoides avenae]|nr:hypothetical protein AAVH_22812 [Aphelenchus avenae]
MQAQKEFELALESQHLRRLSDCVFGSALSSAKNGFSDDVVTAQVNAIKVIEGFKLETTGENLPSSCNMVFEPYKPEPQYPYEPYPYEHYEPEPYQRNPYKRKPYQRNLYQRNPYQRNPYHRRN